MVDPQVEAKSPLTRAELRDELDLFFGRLDDRVTRAAQILEEEGTALIARVVVEMREHQQPLLDRIAAAKPRPSLRSMGLASEQAEIRPRSPRKEQQLPESCGNELAPPRDAPMAAVSSCVSPQEEEESCQMPGETGEQHPVVHSWMKRHIRTHTATAELFGEQTLFKGNGNRQISRGTPAGAPASRTSTSQSSLSVVEQAPTATLNRAKSILPAVESFGETETYDDDDCDYVSSGRGEVERQTTVKSALKTLVQHPCFDYAVGFAIIVNAMFIGAQTQYLSLYLGEKAPVAFDVVEWVFCIGFTAELLTRLYVYRMRFFVSSGKWWNFLDFFLVGLQLLEKTVELVTDLSGWSRDSAGAKNGFSAMRMLRILRVVRIVRLVRVLRLIGELRTIVICIAGSMQSLVWTVVLLILLIYITAVYMTQVVSEHRLQHGQYEDGELTQYFGSLFRSVLTLYEATSGGLSWNTAVHPLIVEISPLLGLLFVFYVTFVLLAIMNVVTGVFVEAALQTAQRDKDVYMVHNVRELFASTDTNLDGVISWEEFQGSLKSPEMRETLKLIDIDPGEAWELFQILDIDAQGSVSFEDFINGCLRLRGPAKSIDLLTVIYEQRKLTRRVAGALKTVHSSVQGLREQMDAMMLEALPVEDGGSLPPTPGLPPLPIPPAPRMSYHSALSSAGPNESTWASCGTDPHVQQHQQHQQQQQQHQLPQYPWPTQDQQGRDGRPRMSLRDSSADLPGLVGPGSPRFS